MPVCNVHNNMVYQQTPVRHRNENFQNPDHQLANGIDLALNSPFPTNVE